MSQYNRNTTEATAAATKARTKTCKHGVTPKTTCRICESERKRQSRKT